jgi:hypothetical protein
MNQPKNPPHPPHPPQNLSQSSTSESLFLTQDVTIMTAIAVIVPAIVLALEIAWIMREG